MPWMTATLPSSQSSLMGSMPGLKPQLVVDLEYVVFGDGDRRPKVAVVAVVVWDDRIEGVVAAPELHDDEFLPVVPVCH